MNYNNDDGGDGNNYRYYNNGRGGNGNRGGGRNRGRGFMGWFNRNGGPGPSTREWSRDDNNRIHGGEDYRRQRGEDWHYRNESGSGSNEDYGVPVRTVKLSDDTRRSSDDVFRPDEDKRRPSEEKKRPLDSAISHTERSEPEPNPKRVKLDTPDASPVRQAEPSPTPRPVEVAPVRQAEPVASPPPLPPRPAEVAPVRQPETAPPRPPAPAPPRADNMIIIYPDFSIKTVYQRDRSGMVSIVGRSIIDFATKTQLYPGTVEDSNGDTFLPFEWSNRASLLDIVDGERVFMFRLTDEAAKDLDENRITQTIVEDDITQSPELKKKAQLRMAKGPLFIVIGSASDGPYSQLPAGFTDYVNETVIGQKFLVEHPYKKAVSVDDLSASIAAGNGGSSAVSFTSVFSDSSFREDDCTGSSTLLTFDSNESMSPITTAMLFGEAVEKFTEKYGRRAAQWLGALVEFLGSRRVPFSYEAILGFVVYHRMWIAMVRENSEYSDLPASVIDMMTETIVPRTTKHRFFLTARDWKTPKNSCPFMSTGHSRVCAVQRQIFVY